MALLIIFILATRRRCPRPSRPLTVAAMFSTCKPRRSRVLMTGTSLAASDGPLLLKMAMTLMMMRVMLVMGVIMVRTMMMVVMMMVVAAAACRH